MTVKYTLSELYRLKRGNGYPDSSVCQKLKSLNLFHARSPKKQRNNSRPIETIITTRRRRKPVTNKPYKHFEIPRTWYDLPTLLLSNVTSLSNKLEELNITAKSVNSKIIAITEAWQIIPEICNFSDYSLFYHLRVNKRGGGVALYVDNDLKPHKISVDIPEGVEALWVRVTPKNSPRNCASIVYCVVYHPPRSPTKDTLLLHLIDTSDILKTRYPCSKIVICGDFNEVDTSDLQAQLNLSQVVDFPTCGRNTLDLIMTDMADLYNSPRPLPPLGRSTHISLVWEASPTPTPAPQSLSKTYRPITDSGTRHFGQWVTNYPWTEVLNCENIEQMWNNYQETTLNAYHNYFPERTVTLHPEDVPWITHRIKRLMQQRNRAYHHQDTNLYKSLRNKIIREIRAAKKAYYPSKLQHLKQANIGQWYDKIKELTGSNKQRLSSFPCVNHLSNEEAAHEINNHFANICQQIPPLDPPNLPAFLPAPSPSNSVEEFQVSKRLLDLKTKRSTTPIDLPMKLYKEFAPELSKPLAHIINASLTQSKCPSDWKTSYISPIPKTTNPQSLNELRPIAITPIPSLICESFVFDWAYSDVANSIDPQQFGNMKTSSTTHCLVSFLDFIYRNLEKRKTSVVLAFIDFTKAFDLVNHNIIIKKATDLGLRPYLISWLAEFLSGRKQIVRYNGTMSDSQTLTCGVPQGTKMGPLCFLILINDALMDTNARWKYVDDSTLGISINNTTPDFSPLQDTINNLREWTTANDVTINHSKTMVMHINLGTDDIPPPVITLDQDTLQVVKIFKLLGVTLDDNLNWKTHINIIIQAASYRLYLLRRLKSLGVPASELINVYSLFILPKLTYASPAWSSSLTATQKDQLEKVQKRACKIIMGPHYINYQTALTSLNLSTLVKLHHHTLCNFGIKLSSHPRHKHLLPPPVAPPLRATRHSNLLQPIRARTTRYQKSPIPSIVKIINHM